MGDEVRTQSTVTFVWTRQRNGWCWRAIVSPEFGETVRTKQLSPASRRTTAPPRNLLSRSLTSLSSHRRGARSVAAVRQTAPASALRTTELPFSSPFIAITTWIGRLFDKRNAPAWWEGGLRHVSASRPPRMSTLRQRWTNALWCSAPSHPSVKAIRRTTFAEERGRTETNGESVADEASSPRDYRADTKRARLKLGSAARLVVAFLFCREHTHTRLTFYRSPSWLASPV